jgi:hypothetical protein
MVAYPTREPVGTSLESSEAKGWVMRIASPEFVVLYRQFLNIRG